MHGVEDLIGAVGHQPVSKTVAQAAHEVNSAGGKTANTAGAVSSAVLGKHLLTQLWQGSSIASALLSQPWYKIC